MVDIGGQKAYVMHNLTGNVMALYSTDGSNTLLAEYDYSPYGEVIKMTGELAQKNPLRYSSRYHDDVLNLHYYGHRHYAPRLMRWLNKDPMGEQYSSNLYQFVLSNPVNYWDRLGLQGTGSGAIKNSHVFYTPGGGHDPNGTVCGTLYWMAKLGLYYKGGEIATRFFDIYASGNATEIGLTDEETIMAYENSHIIQNRELGQFGSDCAAGKNPSSGTYPELYLAEGAWRFVLQNYWANIDIECKNCVLTDIKFNLADEYDFKAGSHENSTDLLVIAGRIIGSQEGEDACGWNPYFIKGSFLFEDYQHVH